MKDFQLIHIRNHQVEDREKLHRWIDKYLDNLAQGKDKDYEICFDETDKTKAQNNYYWGQLTKMARAYGSTPDKLHEYFKEMFLPTERFIVLIADRKRATTKGLEKDLMTEYIDKCIQFSAEELQYVWGDCEEYRHQYQF